MQQEHRPFHRTLRPRACCTPWMTSHHDRSLAPAPPASALSPWHVSVLTSGVAVGVEPVVGAAADLPIPCSCCILLLCPRGGGLPPAGPVVVRWAAPLPLPCLAAASACRLLPLPLPHLGVGVRGAAAGGARTGDDQENLQSNARSCFGRAVDTLFYTYHLSDLRYTSCALWGCCWCAARLGRHPTRARLWCPDWALLFLGLALTWSSCAAPSWSVSSMIVPLCMIGWGCSLHATNADFLLELSSSGARRGSTACWMA